MQKYIEIFENFQKWNSELINQMKNCSHHFDSKNLSPYHLENDVWTHTVLMYKDFMEISSNITNHNEALKDILDCLSIIILCHDIGKVYTRHVPNNQYGKIAFYNHSFASIQKTIDFIEYLNRFQTGFHMDSEKIHSVLNVISNHMDFHQIKDDGKYGEIVATFANYDILKSGLTLLFNAFDKRNSIDNNLNFLNKDYNNDVMTEVFKMFRDNINKEYPELNKDFDIIIYCGVPGCGKDYISEIENDVTLSYDDIRIDLYLESNPDDIVMKKSELYKKAWDWCNKQNINLNDYLKKGVVGAIESGKSVGIANTNLSRKARRSLSNLLNDYKIKFVYIGCTSDKLMYRNLTRGSKNLEKMVMNKFMYNQQIPCMWEFEKCKNVVNVELVCN